MRAAFAAKLTADVTRSCHAMMAVLAFSASAGRPVDVEQLPDGSLLVSDDEANAVYRIWYTPPPG